MMQSGEEYMSEVLAECLDMVISGASVASCYERFPEHVSELESLLGTIARVQNAPAVPSRNPAVAEDRRSSFMHAAYDMHVTHSRKQRWTPAAAPTSWLSRIVTRVLGPQNNFGRQKSALFPIFSYLLLIVFTGILVTGVVTASAASLPGDFLYPVKTASESVQLFFTRDADARSELQQVLTDRRIDEAKAVLDLQRTATLPLQGIIEQLEAGSWIVSGLHITLTSETRIEGEPAVGARVEGRMRAPGNGSLVALQVEVVESAASIVVAPVTPNPAPHTAMPRPTFTNTPTRPASPTATATLGVPVHLPTIPFVEPPDPTATVTPLPTATPTATATNTPTRVRPTLTPMPTATPQGRDLVEGHLSGTVMAIDNDRWLINEVWIQTYAGTRYGGNPRVNGQVEARIGLRSDAIPLALEIIEKPASLTKWYNVTGAIVELAPLLTLEFGDGARLSYRVAPDAEYPNGPVGIGDEATVEIEEGVDGRIAHKIIKISGPRATFHEGPIEEMAGDHWIINGKWIVINGMTRFHGTGTIGAWARANGYLEPGSGAFIAEDIYILD